MNSQNYTPAAEPDPEPERLVSGPRGTKVLLPSSTARALKSRARHTGLKGRPLLAPLPDTAADAADASTTKEGKSVAQ